MSEGNEGREVITFERLTRREELERIKLERVVRRGDQWLRKTATALAKIEAGRLYRSTHPDFRSYVMSVFGFDAQYARNICAAGKVLENLEKRGNHLMPETERQARILVGLGDAEADEAWRRAVQACSGHRPTPIAIEREADLIRQFGIEGSAAASLAARGGEKERIPERQGMVAEEYRAAKAIERLVQARKLLLGCHKLLKVEGMDAVMKAIEEAADGIRKAALENDMEVGEGAGVIEVDVKPRTLSPSELKAKMAEEEARIQKALDSDRSIV